MTILEELELHRKQVKAAREAAIASAQGEASNAPSNIEKQEANSYDFSINQEVLLAKFRKISQEVLDWEGVRDGRIYMEIGRIIQAISAGNITIGYIEGRKRLINKGKTTFFLTPEIQRIIKRVEEEIQNF